MVMLEKTIRAFNEDDWPQVEALYKDFIGECVQISKYPLGLWDAFFRPIYPDIPYIGFVYEEFGIIKGYIFGHGQSEKGFFIDSLYVVPESRESGAEGFLSGLLANHIKSIGYRWIACTTSPNHSFIKGLLEKLEFQQGDITYFREI